MSIANELLILDNTKKNIKEALRQCNVPLNGETFREYVDKIDEVIPQTQQWGATLLDWFGVVDEQGNFTPPTATWDFDASEEFAGEQCIRKVPANCLNGFLVGKKIKSINLKDLTEVEYYGMQYFASSCTSLETIDLSNLEIVGDYGLTRAFENSKAIHSCNVSKIRSVGNYGLSYMFNQAGTSELDLSFDSLEIVTGTHPLLLFASSGTFNTITFPKLTSSSSLREFATYTKANKVSFPMLENCDDVRNAFAYSKIKEIDLSKLKTFKNGNAIFNGCGELLSIHLDSIERVTDGVLDRGFWSCSKLTAISFPSLITVSTYGFSNTDGTEFAFEGCTALTEMHFRSDMKEQVEAMAGYSSKFGATNATIYFDL